MTVINETINVDTYFFKGQKKGLGELKTYPKAMELRNQRYTFEDGLQCLIKRGQRVVQLFDMTDGRTRFRLKLEDNQWTLIGTRSAA
jgi:hypothetical protein